MKASIHSHCDGETRTPRALIEEVLAAVSQVDVPPIKGAAPRIRRQLLSKLKAYGWSGKVPVHRGLDISITSMRDGVGLCLQTGNMARMYADLIKLQTLYLNNAISSAIIILPSSPLALVLGDNIAQAQRLERELEVFRKAYHAPTLLISLE